MKYHPHYQHQVEPRSVILHRADNDQCSDGKKHMLCRKTGRIYVRWMCMRCKTIFGEHVKASA